MKRKVAFTLLWWLTMVAFVWTGTEHFTEPVVTLKLKFVQAGEFGTSGWLRSSPALLWGIFIMLRDLFVAVGGLFLATYAVWALFVPKDFSPLELLPRRSPTAAVARPLSSIADVMLLTFERRYVRCLWALLTALFTTMLLWRIQPTIELTATALIVGAMYLLLAVRQGLMQWRVTSGRFGDNEHEVRQFLWFVLTHTRDDDFTIDSGVKPPFHTSNQRDVAAEAAPVTS